MNKKLSIVLWTVLCILLICCIGYVSYTYIKANTQEVIHPEVTFEIENYGTVKMELYPEYAPNTVANFIKLVQEGYYNGKVIYGKDGICLYVGRTSDGTVENPTISIIDKSIEAGSDADYEYEIAGEFVANGFEQNTLRHEKGVVSLIRSDYTQQVGSLTQESYNSGNAQIGIMMEDSRGLNGIYAAFARITEGLDILEKINEELEIEVNEGEEDTSSGIEAFAAKPVITSATAQTYGVDYGTPTISKAFDYNSYLYNLLSEQYSE